MVVRDIRSPWPKLSSGSPSCPICPVLVGLPVRENWSYRAHRT